MRSENVSVVESEVASEVEVDTSSSLTCKHMSRNLAKAIGLPTPVLSRVPSHEWTPPPVHGLDNSDPIIPSYYLTGKDLRGNLFHIDFLYTIQDNIRNYRPLTDPQQAYLKTLSADQLVELVLLYNDMHESLQCLLVPSRGGSSKVK